jgi:pyruvate ferredoxin oxidoreductase delta subunit
MAEQGAVIKHDLKKGPKTGAWRYMHPEVDKTKCIGCGTCVEFCPEASITVDSERKSTNKKSKKGTAEIDYDYCKGCGVCAEVCPAKAILMKKR